MADETSTSLQTEDYASLPSNKRKRDDDSEPDDSARGTRQSTNGDSSTTHTSDQIRQHLLQAIGQSNGVQDDDNARTAQAALASSVPASTYPPPDATFDSVTHGLSFSDDTNQSPPAGLMGSTAHALYAAREASTPTHANKPAVGTPQWHQQRKDNHKEVERRRRETINDGINEIAKIVPGCEKNKGSILQRAVHYIQELLHEQQRWSTERNTLDSAVRELALRFDKMKENADRYWDERSKWQQRCRDAGLQFEDYDDAPAPVGEREEVHAD